jgi:hypothetical protein
MGNALLDLVWGLIAFAALLAISFLTRQQQDIRPALLMTCVAFFAAAFYRAVPGRKRLWLTTLLVAIGGVVPVIAMNQFEIAFTATATDSSRAAANGPHPPNAELSPRTRMPNNFTSIYWPAFSPSQWPSFTPPLTELFRLRLVSKTQCCRPTMRLAWTDAQD